MYKKLVYLQHCLHDPIPVFYYTLIKIGKHINQEDLC